MRELERLVTLRSYGILDTAPEAEYDNLVELAARVCQTPHAALTFVDAERQWFKAGVGLDSSETPRDASLCQYTMQEPGALVIPDTLQDGRYRRIGELTGIRFYAGASLVSPEGTELGALCVYDKVERDLTAEQKEVLTLLGQIASSKLELRRSLIRLDASEERFRSVFERGLVGAVLMGVEGLEKGLVLEANTAALSILGSRTSTTTYLDDVLALEGEGSLTDLVLSSESHDGEYKVRRLDGEVLHLRVRSASVRSTDGQVTHAILQVEDITVEKRALEALEVSVLTDPLTMLPNRRAASELLTRLDRQERTGSTAVLFVDLDRFKTINDTQGHEVGDHLLKRLATELQGTLRGGDFAGRLSGDEFVIICKDLPADEKDAKDITEALAERVTRRLALPYDIQGREVSVGASVGIAIAAPGTPVGRLLGDADAAMYQAKGEGRGRWFVFDEKVRSDALRKSTLEQGLHGAIERDELTLVYQPVVSLPDEVVTGHEVLLRWTYKGEQVSPQEFIAVAEESGSIVPIGEWVLDTALKDLGHALRKGIKYGEDYTLAVNVSTLQVRKEDFSMGVITKMAKYGVPPSRLSLEVTEGAVLDVGEGAMENLRALRALGVGVGVDDFGTGHSSLTSLRKLPATFVKVDRSFVDNMLGSEDDASIVRAVVGLGLALRLKVVAEGVEDQDQAAAVCTVGATHAQGYYYGRPAGDPWA